MTNGHRDLGLQNRFTEWAKSRGHDGLHHTGGWNIGVKEHSVWIAFEPNQIKATNAETFDSTSDDMYKAHDEEHVGGVKLTGENGDWVFIHRSSKQPGMWQTSYFDNPNPTPDYHIPDTQHKTLQKALAVAEKKGFQVEQDIEKGSFQLKRMIDMVQEAVFFSGDMRQARAEDAMTVLVKENPSSYRARIKCSTKNTS